MEPIRTYGYFLKECNEPLVREEFEISEINNDEVVVEVSGCGLCHTDITFLSGQVTTKQALPLVLGHEISGKVVAASESFQSLVGKNVIVPAVLPCGECELCQAERDNMCQHQKMPGNDFNGGFSTHLKVPGRFLCQLPDDLKGFKPSQLSVVADAITTPYQSVTRSGLKKGEVAVVVGVGGVGIYTVQHAKNVGATVIAIDIDDDKLKVASEQGADFIFSAKDNEPRALKKAIKGLAKEQNLPKYFWKIFETSGTAAGQDLAFSLLGFAGTLGVVGFTMDKVKARLSNLMAFDADMFGNWGCRPQYYSNVVSDVLENKIKLKENIEERPLDSINETIKQSLNHELDKRIIFVP